MAKFPVVAVRMLALLLTAALIPPSALVLRDSLHRLQLRSHTAQAQAERAARWAAAAQAKSLDEARTALRTMAGLSSIAYADPSACKGFFVRAMEGFPVPVRNLGLARPPNTVTCGARAFSDRFPPGIAAGGRLASLLPPDRLVTGVPLTNGRGWKATVFAVIPLRRPAFPLPAGTTIILLDRSGRAARYDPLHHDWLEQGPGVSHLLRRAEEGPVRTSDSLAGPDGVRRRYAFAALGPDIYLAAGAAAPSRTALYLHSAWVATLIAASFWLSGIGRDRFLTDLSRRWAADVGGKVRHAKTALRRFASWLPVRRRRPNNARRDGDQTKTELRQANEHLRQSVQSLERRTREMAALGEMRQLLQTCTDSEEICRIVARFARALFLYRAGGLFHLDPKRNMVEKTATWGAFAGQKPVFAPDDCWALRAGRVHRVAGPGAEPCCTHVTVIPPGGYTCIPLLAHGKLIGLLHLQNRHAPAAETGQNLIRAFSEVVAQALANLRFLETMRDQSIRDPLTGLYNRRFLEETLTIEEHRASRGGAGVGIIMLDLDHFKRINDSAGHDAGDAVLRAVGDFLQDQVREGDIPCRYGGEEFIIIVPGADPHTTWQRAEAMRQGLAAITMEHNGMPLGPVTASFGTACLPTHGANRHAVLKAADAALYRAKSGGRNRVAAA